MDRKTKGRLAEVKVLSYLIENNYEPFLPFSDNTKLDLIAVKDGKLNRVSVKYTATMASKTTWRVVLTQVSRRNKGTVQVDKFDSSEFDLLAVYIGPLDKVVLVDAKSFTNTAQLNLLLED